MQKEQLYQLLMNKPIPDNKKQHDIKINKVEILEAEDPEEQKQIVKAVVVDRTDENRIDRDDALMRIRRAKKKALEEKRARIFSPLHSLPLGAGAPLPPAPVSRTSCGYRRPHLRRRGFPALGGKLAAGPKTHRPGLARSRGVNE